MRDNRAKKRFDAQLSHTATFYSPNEVETDYGVDRDGWNEEFTRWANVFFKMGGESVLASRLTGKNVVSVTVRRDSDVERVTTDWMAMIDGAEYNIRGAMPHNKHRGYWEFLAESGAAI